MWKCKPFSTIFPFSYFLSISFPKYIQWQCILSFDNSTTIFKDLKSYTLAGFEPEIFCSWGGCDVHCQGVWYIPTFCTYIIQLSLLHHLTGGRQGCQMVYFQTKNHKLGKFLEGRVMEKVGIFYVFICTCWENLTAIWNILWSIGAFYGLLVHFRPVW
jgi:hypothetical protein